MSLRYVKIVACEAADRPPKRLGHHCCHSLIGTMQVPPVCREAPTTANWNCNSVSLLLSLSRTVYIRTDTQFIVLRIRHSLAISSAAVAATARGRFMVASARESVLSVCFIAPDPLPPWVSCETLNKSKLIGVEELTKNESESELELESESELRFVSSIVVFGRLVGGGRHTKQTYCYRLIGCSHRLLPGRDLIKTCSIRLIPYTVYLLPCTIHPSPLAPTTLDFRI